MFLSECSASCSGRQERMSCSTALRQSRSNSKNGHSIRESEAQSPHAQSQVKGALKKRSSCPASVSRSVLNLFRRSLAILACNSRRYLGLPSQTLSFRRLPAHQLALRSLLCSVEPGLALLLLPFLIRYWVCMHHVVGQQQLK